MIGIKKPDIVLSCAGGGSNFAGMAFLLPMIKSMVKTLKLFL